MTSRRQATLYLPLADSTAIESLRARFNRVQFELIRAHVRLCREDEVSDWDKIASRLSDPGSIEVKLSFGGPVLANILKYLLDVFLETLFQHLICLVKASYLQMG